MPATDGAGATPHQNPTDPASLPFPRVVLWTRGSGCSELALLLASERAVRVEGCIDEACVRERADLVVQRKLSSFDLTDVAVPDGFDPDGVDHVVAAVGGGPHSALAAHIAERLGGALGVSATALSGYRDTDDRLGAERLLRRAVAGTGLDGRAVHVSKAADLIPALPGRSLIVLGAAGGNWFQRQLFGPGHRLSANAPAGAVIVRRSSRKAFRSMVPPEWLSPHLRAADAVAVMMQSVVPVVDEGKVLGVVRRRVIAALASDEPIGGHVEDAPLVGVLEPAEALAEVADFYEGSPVPLVDGRGMLIGMAPPPATRPAT